MSLDSKDTGPIDMKLPHSFEFMDLDWLPKSFRNTLRDILECGNAKPFRPYYDWACKTILKESGEINSQRVVELGAGTAPLTRRLASNPQCQATLIPCDRNPDIEVYKDLENTFAEKVTPRYDIVDFTKLEPWPPQTMLVLSATLHHLPSELRKEAIIAMGRSADAVLILEPLRRTISSLLFVCLSLVPAILAPLLLMHRPGGLRRFFWCWLVPLAPWAFLWDGWVSCIRQWNTRQYQDAVKGERVSCVVTNHGPFAQSILLKRHS